MGGSSWSNDFYAERTAARKASNTPVFKHHDDVVTGKVASAIHERLDPLKFKNGMREARDSTEHPDSVPIIFLLDVTGSMASVPRVVQGQLNHLMTDILTNGYLKDPQVCFGAIGDAYSDKVPLQIGQFESGIEIDDDITHIFLEGNGGGQNQESYELGFYFAARKTATDAWEKRQRKGYLFITGDEHAYPSATKQALTRAFGVGEEADIPLETLVRECKERYHVFFLLPNTSLGRSPQLRAYWSDLLGAESLLDMPDATQVCRLVARKIGEIEGTLLPDAAKPTDKAASKVTPVDASAKKVDDAKAAGDKTARL